MRGPRQTWESEAVLRALKENGPSEPHVKQVFTTGEVAEICKISQQTVIRCFDSGKLHGFRVPGSKFRRIPRESLLLFMKAHDIPLDTLDGHANGKKRVLVVDDEVEIVDMLEEILTQDGRFEVRTASNGFDAGALAKELSPDIMLLDYMLPGINGNEVCRRVRNDVTLAGMKIIIVSGAVERSQLEELKNAGADDFVKKPFDPDELVGKMAEMLKL